MSFRSNAKHSGGVQGRYRPRPRGHCATGDRAGQPQDVAADHDARDVRCAPPERRSAHRTPTSFAHSGTALSGSAGTAGDRCDRNPERGTAPGKLFAGNSSKIGDPTRDETGSDSLRRPARSGFGRIVANGCRNLRTGLLGRGVLPRTSYHILERAPAGQRGDLELKRAS